MNVDIWGKPVVKDSFRYSLGKNRVLIKMEWENLQIQRDLTLEALAPPPNSNARTYHHPHRQLRVSGLFWSKPKPSSNYNT